MFLDLREGVLAEFAERSLPARFDRSARLHVAPWFRAERLPTAADFPRLAHEARLALPLRGLLGASERRRARHARLVEQRRVRGPQRVGNVSRGVARRADPAYRERERVRQARAARERRRRAREAALLGS